MSTAAYLDRRLVQDPSIVARKIADEFILVPIRHSASDVDSIYALNDVAARVWELVDGRKNVRDIRDCIVDEFEVGPEEAEADVVEFLRQLEGVGAVRDA